MALIQTPSTSPSMRRSGGEISAINRVFFFSDLKVGKCVLFHLLCAVQETPWNLTVTYLSLFFSLRDRIHLRGYSRNVYHVKEKILMDVVCRQRHVPLMMDASMRRFGIEEKTRDHYELWRKDWSMLCGI
ncbi:hypothetical protein Bca4012_006042 [Brassica carinata]